MTKLTVITLIVLVCVCRCMGYYEFSAYDNSAIQRKTRVRSCTPNAESCYYCDCYTSPCNIPKETRQLNKYYAGIFTTQEELQKIINGSSEAWTIKSSVTIVSGARGYKPCPPGPPGPTNGCCDTVYTALSPKIVERNGVTRVVVTPLTSQNMLTTFQVVWVGTCPETGQSCCNNGVCRNEVGYPTFILVHSTTNNFQYEFIPIVYSRFCKCGSIAP